MRERMPSAMEKKAAHLEQQLSIQSKNFASVLSELEGKTTELEKLRKLVQREVAARESAEGRLAEAEGLAKSAVREAREAEAQLEEAGERHDTELREMSGLLEKLQQQWAIKKQQYARLSSELQRRSSLFSMANGSANGSLPATPDPPTGGCSPALEERVLVAEGKAKEACEREQAAAEQLEEARAAAAEMEARLETSREAAEKELSALRAELGESKARAAQQQAASGQNGARMEMEEVKAAHAKAVEMEREKHAKEVGALKQEQEAILSDLREQLEGRAAALSEVQASNDSREVVSPAPLKL